MENVARSTKRGTAARRSRIASLAACAVLLSVPAAASAASTTATTAPADPSLITDTYALLSGIVNPGGVATAYWFQWGRTTAYGQGTPVTQAGNGTADVPVDVSLDTLKPGTTYHYRLWAKPTGDPTAGDVVGVDQSFTTAPALAVSIVGRAARVSATGKAALKLKALGPSDEIAEGVLKLTANVGGQVRSFGSVTYKVAAGTTKTVGVSVTAAGRRALSAAKGKKLTVSATAKTSGIKRPVVEKLTLAAS
jgi:hypothetical protein